MSTKDGSKKSEKIDSKLSLRNIIIMAVIAVIIVTFVFTAEPILGFRQFFTDIGKEKVPNEDGTISIPNEAQSGENRNNPNSYVGKVLNEKIQIGKEDEFNLQLQRVFGAQQLDPYTKYQYTRYFFDRAINKIIGMYNARKMNITISKVYLTKEIGKRYFSDKDGDPDYDAMRRDTTKVNKYSKDVLQDLLYQNYITDFFSGMPVSQTEIWENYKMDNTKVSLKYLNLSNQDVDDKKLQSYFNENKDSFKKYKLTRLVFKDKKDADDNLSALVADSSKFTEVGNKLKSEDKLINVVYDPDFSFLDDFENQELKDAVLNTAKGSVANSVIQTSVGPVIILKQDEKFADYSDDATVQKVKNDYFAKNFLAIETENKNKAEEIYNYAKNRGIDKAAKKYSLKTEIMQNPSAFLDYGFPFLNPDNTDDINYIVKIFKSKVKDVLEPFHHENGYLIAAVNSRESVDFEKFSESYSDLEKQYSKEKSEDIENDFYKNERKKYQVVDNFNYVFKIQDFMKQQENE